jgi:EAL domain-containing protein (putative c-di-GMP-specific phosphodiesterase class I)
VAQYLDVSPVRDDASSDPAGLASGALLALDAVAAQIDPSGRLTWSDPARAAGLFGLALAPDAGLPDSFAILDDLASGALSKALAEGRPVRQRIGRLLEFRCDSAGILTVRRLGTMAADRRAADASAVMVRQAIEERRLILMHQPIIDTRSGAVLRHECLARILDTDGSMISPALFIPVAERAGLIGMLDLATLDSALASMGKVILGQLAVNVSAATVADEHTRAAYLARLARSPAQAARLTVEITETLAIEDLDVAARFAGEVRKLGARVALDDFGEGHTSFRSLLKIPLDEVKIDGLYVEKIDSRKEARAFVRAIEQLSRDLGLETVAEKVETAGEAAELRQIGVGSMQGYHFGRPVAPGE